MSTPNRSRPAWQRWSAMALVLAVVLVVYAVALREASVRVGASVESSLRAVPVNEPAPASPLPRYPE